LRTEKTTRFIKVLRRVTRVRHLGAFTLQHAIDGRGGALRTEKTTRFIKVLRRVTRVR
jgi:hypothetical protein